MSIPKLNFPDKQDGVSFLFGEEVNETKRVVNLLVEQANDDETSGEGASTDALRHLSNLAKSVPAGTYQDFCSLSHRAPASLASFFSLNGTCK